MDHKPSLIVVDDEELLLSMLKQSFAEHGFPCRTFPDAQSALAALASAPAEILITDITMPGMRGLELTREAKRMHPDLNVIIMTGFVDDFSYDQAIDAGAADFIKKPFTIQELMMRIKHVKLQEKLRTISITDELTGLLNRRGFFALAEQQLKVLSRAKMSMALLFGDLDGLKAINDTWGHQQGDLALIAMADIFRQTFRESDIIARMSGDEFAALLVDTPEKDIPIVSDRLYQNIASFNEHGGAAFTLSISTGVSQACPESRSCSIDELLKEADERMYRNKLQKKQGKEEPGRA